MGCEIFHGGSCKGDGPGGGGVVVMAFYGGCDLSGGELATVADMNCRVDLIIVDDRNMPSPVYKYDYMSSLILFILNVVHWFCPFSQ